MVLGNLDSNMQKNEPGPYTKYTIHKINFLTPHTKINSKWMKDLNVRQEANKILEEKASKNLFDLGHSNLLLNMSLEARETKSKNELLGPHQNKKLLHNKENNQQN